MFRHRAEELGVGRAVRFLHEVDSINNRRRVRTVDLIRELAGGDLAGVRVAALGAAEWEEFRRADPDYLGAWSAGG